MTDEAIVDGDLAADGKLSDAAVLKRLIQQHWLRHKAKGGAG